jgi:hypothetical protein
VTTLPEMIAHVRALYHYGKPLVLSGLEYRVPRTGGLRGWMPGDG